MAMYWTEQNKKYMYPLFAEVGYYLGHILGFRVLVFYNSINSGLGIHHSLRPSIVSECFRYIREIAGLFKEGTSSVQWLNYICISYIYLTAGRS